MSASARASAQASLPEISISWSSLTTGAAFVSSAMRLSSLPPLGLGVLTGDARGDLDAAHVQVPLDLLLVLAAEAEPVGADHVLRVVDLLGHPRRVLLLVLAPHLPLARVVLEGGLVHHRDAFLGRAHRLADATAAARLHVGVVEAVGGHVEAGVRTLDPAERALHTLVEVDHRPHGPRGELLEVRVALRHVALATLHGLADGDGGDADALAHLPPLGLLEGVGRLGVALGDRHRADLEPVMSLPR